MRLLLDAHLSPVMARLLTTEGIDTVSLRDWQGGEYLRASDETILMAALAEERVLVTFDRATIPPLVREWAQSGRAHAGVIMIHSKTIRPDDIGGLVRALRQLVEREGEQDWRDRLAFLQSSTTS